MLVNTNRCIVKGVNRDNLCIISRDAFYERLIGIVIVFL